MKNNIVYFDGVCGLCNKSVDFIIRHDKKKKLLFTPLQGETAKLNLHSTVLESFDSILFQQNNQLYYKSDAAIKIMYTIGGLWKSVIILFIFPKFIRDAVYSFIAKYRYKWFGKKESCRIPTKDEREQFLP